jgi:hypothetical protein
VHVEVLERLVANTLTTRDAALLGSDGRTAKGTKRIAWLRKKSRIEKIKQELKVALSAIHLELLSLNLCVPVSPITRKKDAVDFETVPAKPKWFQV